jgi:Cu(I)/Ag(I) efflux system membrane fusion protein
MNRKLLTAGLIGAIALALVSKGGAGTRAVELNPRVQQNCGIRVAEVIRGRLSSEVIASGTIVGDEREVALTQARANGFVERLRVRAAGDKVHHGEVLADLYVPDWFAAQVAYLAVRDLKCAGSAELAEGAGQRLHRLGMPEDLIRVLEETGRPQSRVALTAPISGVVTELTAREGVRVTTGAPLFRINGLSTVYINVDVPERLGQTLRAGDAVSAQTATLPDAVFVGTVANVLPSVNLATRTLSARVALPNPNMQLLPGMSVIVRLASTAEADALLVPSEAVIATRTGLVVTVYGDDGRFRPVNVEIGSQSGGRTEIRSGLAAGQKVIVFEYLNQVESRSLSPGANGPLE